MRQDNEAKALVEELKQKGLAVQQKTSVHPSSLRGFVREQISELVKSMFLQNCLELMLQIKLK